MTAQYAAAADLVARSAAAFVSGVPANPADDGFFGPGSVTWRISTDLSAPVAGLRSLMMQALHPLAMAGVDQHSDWRKDPAGRLAATQAYVITVSFGDRQGARAAAERVRRIHEHVRGTDRVTGQAYAAGDPALLLWVHAALVDSALAAANQIGTPLNDDDADSYVAEMVTAAELVGVSRDMVPAGVTALRAYIDSVRPVLQATPAAIESMSYLLKPAGLDADIADLWQEIAAAAVGLLPGWAREAYGYQSAPANRDEVRQVLGVMDTIFLGEPGVLEARQLIAARQRAAE